MPQSSDRVPPIDDWNRLLDGRVAVVTGGGDGIGGAISTLFAAHGALVEVAEIDPARAAAVVTGIEATGGTAPPTWSMSPRRPTSTGSRPMCSTTTAGSTCW